MPAAVAQAQSPHLQRLVRSACGQVQAGRRLQEALPPGLALYKALQEGVARGGGGRFYRQGTQNPWGSRQITESPNRPRAPTALSLLMHSIALGM